MPELDEILKKVDAKQRTFEFFANVMKFDHEQAEVAAAAFADKFDWNGVTLTWKESGANAVDDLACHDFFKSKYSFLFPAPAQAADEGKPEVDPALLEAAFIKNNWTARSHVVRAAGSVAEADRLAQQFGLTGVNDRRAGTRPQQQSEKKPDVNADHAKNPWAPTEGNINPKTGRFTEAAIERQFKFTRAVGIQTAAQVAAAVGCRPGDLYASGYKPRAA
jgi:hypothetical protein